jgi:hypothetical protein
MAYIAKYINNLVQFGTVSLDLILSDSDGIMPDKRISKNFTTSDQVTEESLLIEAQKEINFAIEEYNNGQL